MYAREVHVDKPSSEQSHPVNRFGWVPQHSRVSDSMSTHSIPASADVSHYSTVKTPVRARTLHADRSNSSGSQTQKRSSDSVSKSSTLTPTIKGGAYYSKRDRMDDSSSQRSYTSRTPVSRLQTTGGDSHPVPRASYLTSRVSSLHAPVHPTNRSNPVTPTRVGVSASPSVSRRSPTITHGLTPPSHRVPTLTRPSPQSQSISVSIDLPPCDIEDPVLTFTSGELVDVEPPKDISAEELAARLQEIEEICRDAAVMKLRSPETKMRDRIIELDIIIEKVHMVLQTVMEKRNAFVFDLETMEASVGSYTASLSHNIDVDVETKETLQERHTQIVEEVEALNAAYLESKEMVEKLSQTVSTGCGDDA